MVKAEEFGLQEDTLPTEIEELLGTLEEHDTEGSFRTEAQHYWEESCGMDFEQRSSFVAHAIDALRQRFRETLREIEEA